MRSPTTTKSYTSTTTISQYENTKHTEKQIIICPPSPKRADLEQIPQMIPQKSNSLPPPHITQSGVSIDWTRNIEDLLQSPDGFRLLKHFLQLQNPKNLPTTQNLLPHVSSFSVKNLTLLDRMDFYFACKGFKQQFVENSEITNISLARHIFKKYIQKDSNLRSLLKQKLRISPTIFEIYQENTVQFLQNHVLPLFLKSDTFINYCSELDRKQEREQVHAILPIINEQDDEKTEKSQEYILPKDHIYYFDENQHQLKHPSNNLASSIVSSRDDRGNVTSIMTNRHPPPPSVDCTVSKFSEFSWISERESSISGSSARASFRKVPRPGTIRIPKSKLTRARDTISQFTNEKHKQESSSIGPATTISSSSQNSKSVNKNTDTTLQAPTNVMSAATSNKHHHQQQQLDCRDTKVSG